jgi:hypothetical protein
MPVLLVENNIVAADLKDNWSVYLPVMLLSFVGMLPIIILAEKFQKHKAMILVAITIMIISQILFYQTSLTYLTFSTLLTLFFIAFKVTMINATIDKPAMTQKSPEMPKFTVIIGPISSESINASNTHYQYPTLNRS